jgi:hypothetical protein
MGGLADRAFESTRNRWPSAACWYSQRMVEFSAKSNSGCVGPSIRDAIANDPET